MLVGLVKLKMANSAQKSEKVKEVYERVGLSVGRANKIWGEIRQIIKKSEEKHKGLYTYEMLGEVIDAYADKNEQIMAIYTLGLIVGNIMANNKLSK